MDAENPERSKKRKIKYLAAPGSTTPEMVYIIYYSVLMHGKKYFR